MLTNTDFMITFGKATKESIIKEFNDTKYIVIQNKKRLNSLRTSVNTPSMTYIADRTFIRLTSVDIITYFIRMNIAKMKILNGYLKTDIDYMQKEYEIFKKYASMVMEEYENKETTLLLIGDIGDIMKKEYYEIRKNQGAYLHICNVIKEEYDSIEDYMKVAKLMHQEGLYFD